MIPALFLVIAFASGVDPRRLLILAGAVYFPVVVGGLIVLVTWRGRPQELNQAPLFCEGVAAELRSGASLRHALIGAANSVKGEAIDLPPGCPMTELAARVAGRFPAIAAELRLTVVNAARSGSDVAALFDEIGSLALAQAEIVREVRMATAPGRATALVLIGAPLVYVTGQIGSGGLGRMLASGQQRLAALLGFGLFALGVTVAAIVGWRAGK